MDSSLIFNIKLVVVNSLIESFQTYVSSFPGLPLGIYLLILLGSIYCFQRFNYCFSILGQNGEIQEVVDILEVNNSTINF